MKRVKILAVGDPAVYVYTKDHNQILKQFQQQTGIEVVLDIVSWVDYYNTLLGAFEQYSYDIVMVAGHLWLKEFVEKGYLHAFSDRFRDNPAYEYDDILPSVQAELMLDGRLYLAPSFCDGHMLLYRKSMLKKLPSQVVSIDELMELVQENTDEEGNTFVLKAHPSEIFLDCLPYLRSTGIDVFEQDGTPQFNTPEGVKVLEKYIAMKAFSVGNPSEFGNEKVCEAIQKKRCKLGVSWGGQLGKIMDENCMEPEDIGFSALTTSWNVTWAFGISHLCQDPESAEQLLSYLTAKDVDRQVGAFCGNPTRRSSFERDRDNYSWYPALLGMLERAKPLPHLPYMGQALGILTEQVNAVFCGKASATEALQQAEANILQLREGFLIE